MHSQLFWAKYLLHSTTTVRSRSTGQKLLVACFTTICKEKKSEELEYAFDVLDRTRKGKLSQADTGKYLRSFLTVLLNVVSSSSLDSDQDEMLMSTTSGMRYDRTMSAVARAVEAFCHGLHPKRFGVKGRTGSLFVLTGLPKGTRSRLVTETFLGWSSVISTNG